MRFYVQASGRMITSKGLGYNESQLAVPCHYLSKHQLRNSGFYAEKIKIPMHNSKKYATRVSEKSLRVIDGMGRQKNLKFSYNKIIKTWNTENRWFVVKRQKLK